MLNKEELNTETKVSSNESIEYMLTTFDNPFDPFDEFTSWLLYDKEKGYDSCEKLARIVQISEDMTQKEIDEETYRAIDIIVTNDFTNTYTRATRRVPNSASQD